MRTTRAFIRSFPLALLTILAVGLVTASAPAAPPDSTKDPLFPGAKLVHKFPKEVYRNPLFVTTDKGSRLEIWFDAFDPAPPPRPGVPAEIGGRLPDPRLDMLIWDPIANKELHRLSYPKDPITFPPPSGGQGDGMIISPDGKRLASVSMTYKPPKMGTPYGDWLTQIRLVDIASHKAQVSNEFKEEKVGSATPIHILFAPDGALIALRGATCTIHEPGKDKPRTTFDLTRAADHKTKEYWFKIQDTVMSPDGSQLAVAADGTIIVYELATGKKLFEAARAAPEPKKGGDPVTIGVSLAFASSASEARLVAIESLSGVPKNVALARLFDLKEKKEIGKWTVAERENKPAQLGQGASPWSGDVSAYYNAKSEPRILFDGKVIDGASGKELHKFDAGAGTWVSRDGKALVRLTKKKKEDRTMTVEVWSLDNDK
jgi:hypothetical protein